MQRYFSHKCDGTDVQAGWRRSFTYGRAPNAIDISQDSLTCPSYTDTGCSNMNKEIENVQQSDDLTTPLKI